MRIWLCGVGAVVACLGSNSTLWAFHKHGVKTSAVVVAPAGFTTGFVAPPTGFMTGFVAPPTGFVTGFAAPTGFVGGFGTPGGFVVPGLGGGFVTGAGFNTGAGFSTDAAAILQQGAALENLRRILCGATSSPGSSGSGCADSAAVLREIRDELRDIKAKVGGGGSGTGPSGPTIPNLGISAGFGTTGQSSIGMVFGSTFAQLPPLAQAQAYTWLAEQGADNAIKKLAEAKAMGVPEAELKPVKDRLNALKERLNKLP